MMINQKIIAVVPAHNEQATIGGVVRDLLKYNITPLVVDDGSVDKTAEIAKKLGAIIVTHLINLGQGGALQTGIARALELEAGIIVTFDGDGQHQAKDIPRLIEPIVRGEADIVLGSRFQKSPSLPIIRRIILKLATIYTRLTTGLKINDTHNGLRAFTRQVAKNLNLRQAGMAHASEFIQQTARRKWRFEEAEVEIVYSDYSTKKGQSSLSGFKILFDLWFK